MQHEDYLLWRLRDKPGQSTLALFPPQAVGRSATAAGTALEYETLHQPAACLGGNPEPGSELRHEAEVTPAEQLPNHPEAGHTADMAGNAAEEIRGPSGYATATEHPEHHVAPSPGVLKRSRADYEGVGDSLGEGQPVSESPTQSGQHDANLAGTPMRQQQDMTSPGQSYTGIHKSQLGAGVL